MDERYPRTLRLRRRADFQHVQRRGKRLRTADLVVVTRANRLGHPRFGLTVSRKVGNAVRRNRIKRTLREAIRRNHQGLTGLDVVFIAKPTASLRASDALQHQAVTALTKLRNLCSEKA